MEIKNVVEKDNCSVSFDMYSDGAEWKDYLQKASLALQKQKAVPGYRAGKAPIGVVEKTYGQGLFDTAARNAMPELFNKACAEYNYAPVSNPSFVVVQADMQGFCVMCTFSNYPKVTDLQYKGLKVEKYYRVCTEADIDESIAGYMRQHLYVHEVPREAEIGDMVEVSFDGTNNGKHFEFDHSNNTRFLLGSGNLFAGLDEALVGHVAGDELELTLTMPEDFHREMVRGLTLDLKVRLLSVWQRDLLECTDEYVKENVKGFDTLAEFRESYRKKLQDRYDSECERLFKKNVEKALGEAITCYIPESMIKVVIDRYIATLRNVAAGNNQTAEEALQAEGKTMDDYIAQVRPRAIEQVRVSVALDYIVQNEEIPVTREEIDRHFRVYAKTSGISIDEAIKREGGEEGYVERLLNDRALEIVRNNAEAVMIQVDEIPTSVF